MGIRETLNKNPGITTGATAGILILAIVFIVYQLGGSDSPDIATEAFYTIDDGKTWFADDINKIPPFEKDGKQASRVYVYKCADGKEFVSHLERYTPEGKKAMEAATKAGDANSPVLMEDVMMTGLEVKEPGTDPVKGWVKQSDAVRASRIMELKCADGKNAGIVPVMPD